MIKQNKIKTSRLFLTIFVSFLFPQYIIGQITWQRGGDEPALALQLFHSTHAIILPTTETLQNGDIEFEVSHRFLPTIGDGPKELYGFDGPANVKLALSYGISDDFLASLSRTNINDNLEFILKYRAFEFENEFLPLVVGIRGAAVWNTDPFNRKASENKNFQYFGQLIVNVMFEKKLAVGIIPSFLINSDIYSADKKNSFTFGVNVQYYISSSFSLLTEWNPTVSGYRNKYDSFGIGFELETGGHFFKIVATNNQYLNSSQYLGGSDLDTAAKNWRIGFNLTRLLKF
jgi:hypothetical protein